MTAATISVRLTAVFPGEPGSAGLLGFLHPNYSERKPLVTSGTGFNGRCPSCQPTDRIKALKERQSTDCNQRKSLSGVVLFDP